jgi:hypothetical protein
MDVKGFKSRTQDRSLWSSWNLQRGHVRYALPADPKMKQRLLFWTGGSPPSPRSFAQALAILNCRTYFQLDH